MWSVSVCDIHESYPVYDMQWVLSVDIFQNDSADANIVISSSSESWVEQGQQASWAEQLVLWTGPCIACCAGGETSGRGIERGQA